MEFAGIALLAMYVLGFLCTGMAAFIILAAPMAISAYLGWVLVDAFPAEYLYFLSQSFVWIAPAFLLRKSAKIAMAALTMAVYEWIISVESFVWEFITPVETPLYEGYAFIVIGLHLFILSTTAKWGGEIGYTNWRGRHRFFATSDL